PPWMAKRSETFMECFPFLFDAPNYDPRIHLRQKTVLRSWVISCAHRKGAKARRTDYFSFYISQFSFLIDVNAEIILCRNRTMPGQRLSSAPRVRYRRSYGWRRSTSATYGA